MNVLLPDESKLCVDRIEVEGESIVISVSSTDQAGLCPLCGAPSDRVHSHYQRQPADLPLAGCAVRLDMDVRRFFCDNDDCERAIFTERIHSVLAPYARRTHRLTSQQQQVAFALSGEAGARLLAIMGMAVSPDTLLRLIRRAPEPEMTTPRVLGVDDWAKRKGQSYGTILVDLEKRQTIDLLPERSAESLTKWLRAHPGVEVISRDRGTDYIKGATDGAPDAIQVADRWHLLSNLKDTLKRLLESKRACLKAAAEEATAEPDKSSECKQEVVSSTEVESYSGSADESLKNPPVQTPKMVAEEQTDTPQKLTRTEQEKLARRERRQERYETVRQQWQQGLSIRKIARRLRLSRATVRKYIEAETCPMYPEGVTRGSKLTPYMSYVRQSWEAGCHNTSQIWCELRKLGFDGSRGLVARWAARERVKLPSLHTEGPQSCVAFGPKPAPKSEAVPWSPSRAAWLLIKPEDDLTLEDRQALERMKRTDEDVAEAYSLGQRFIHMIREHQPDALLPWLEDVSRSGMDTLKGFACGIQQDLAAVRNALSLPWSNGQTEGQVNRLKFIKRQMYGRASFDLLRKRVLAYPMRC